MANTYLGKTATLANADLDKLAGGLPGGGRTNTTLAQLLANNLGANPIDFATPGLVINTGVNDARAAIALADAAALAGLGDIIMPPGVYKISAAGSSLLTISSRVKFAKGATLQPVFGVTVRLAGGVEAGDYPIFDESFGGVHDFKGAALGWISIAWWLECTTNHWNTTTPATPTVWDGTASSHNLSPYSGSGGIAAGHTVKASTTRTSVDASGVSRETGPSPLSIAYSVVNESSFGIIPEDPGCGLENGETGIATGWSAYLRDLADNIDHRSEYSQSGSSDGYTRGYVFGWADQPDYLGCSYGAYNSGGGLPPAGGTTATDANGATVKVPPTAPVLVPLGALLRNTQYNAQISYTYGDGTEGPLSLVGSATIGNNAGGYLIVFPGEAPPHGAHFINVYAAKNGDTMRRIVQRPVGPMAIEVHDIPSASDTPVRDPSVAYFDPWTRATAVHPTYPGQGACLSTISPISLAARCARAMGGAVGIRIPVGLNTYKSPLILDPDPTFQNSLGETGFSSGLRIFAEGGLNGVTEMRYLGPLVGVTGIVNTYPRLVIENVRFTEQPGNGRLRYGLRMSDYSGGGSFFCRLINSAIDAEAPHGIGIIGDSASGGTNSHTCSEFMIMGGFVGGRRGPLYFAGAQTGNIHLDQLVQLQSGSDSGAGPNGATSANSFVIRAACANGVFTIETPWMDGGQYTVFLTDTWTREGGGSTVFYGRSLGRESHGQNGGAFGIYCSAMDSGAHQPSVRLTGECGFQGPNEHTFYDLYVGSRSRVTSISNVFQNFIILDNVFAEMKVVGGTATRGILRTTRFYGGGQAPATGPGAYPLQMDRSTSVQTDTMQVGVAKLNADAAVGIQATFITVDTSGGNRTITIPSALYRPGQIIIVKKITSDANTVTIQSLGDQANLGKTFDGAASAAIPGGSKGAIMVISDGTEWKLGPNF